MDITGQKTEETTPDPAAGSKAKPKYDPKLVEEARKRLEHNEQMDGHNQKAQLADTKFVYVPGEQWPSAIKQERDNWGDPCLEFNQMKQFTNQVVNDMRQKRPGIRVHAAGGEASDATADLLQGIVRGIEYESNGEAVYDHGYLHTVVGSRGFWRVVSKYVNDNSFDQKLVLLPIPDPMSVRIDPAFQQPDASDMNWCFVLDALQKDEYHRLYPQADPANWDPTSFKTWYKDDNTIIVADYYRRTFTEKTLVAVQESDATGAQTVKTMWQDQLPTILPETMRVIKTRVVQQVKVEWYTIAGGDQILKEHTWPGTIIPVVMDMGDVITIEGKRHFQGLIRHAKDSQSLFNFGMTQQAIHLSLTPRAPYVMAEGQDEGYEEMWDNANRRNYGKLIYKPTAMDDGQLVPPPQRQQMSMVDSGWASLGQQLNGLIKSTMGGMYENTLGMVGNEVSGKAILAREQQGDTATFHFADNHGLAIALTGRILVECIPTYYDTERMVTYIGEDNERKQVKVNERRIMPDGSIQAIREKNITVGQFAVTIEAGETWKSKRQEAKDFLAEVVKAWPQVLTVAGDVIVKEQGLAGSKTLADRMKYLWPPELKQAEAAREAGEDPKMADMAAQLQQVTQQFQQCEQMLQQVTQELDQVKKDKTAQINASNAKVKESQSKERLNAATVENDRDRLLMETIFEVVKLKMEERSQQAADAAATANAMITSNDSQGA